MSAYIQEDRQEVFVDRTLLRRTLGFALPYRGRVLTALVSLILSQILPLIFPHILQQVVDGPVREGNFPGVVNWILLYLALTAAQAVLLYLAGYLSRRVALDVVHDLRTTLYTKVCSYRMRFFHKTPVGRLMTRMTSDVDQIHNLFSEGLVDLLTALLMLGLSAIFMFVKEWRLALAVCFVVPAMLYMTHLFRVKVRDINRVIRQHLAQLNAVLQESLAGVEIVRLFGKERRRFRLFEEQNNEYRKAFLLNVKYYSLFFPGLFGLSDLSSYLAYLVGGLLVFHGETTVGTLAAFAWYATLFQRPLRDLSDRVTQLQSAVAASERVFSLMDAAGAEQERDGARALPAGPVAVEFRNVSFAYNPENPVLNQVSFRVEPGTTTAIVGHTGAGKSTVIHLINRFYQGHEGEVAIGGIPIQEIEGATLFPRSATVTQDIHLFTDTVRRNILLDREEDPARLAQVLEACRATDFVAALPQGLDTVLEDRGSRLSTGQRQLLSFARALYRNPDLLLLDEATSSVDTGTEAKVQAALGELLRGRTSIVVAHRISTVVKADQILVMHKGAIRERGTHRELLAMGGIYARLVELHDLRE